MLNIDQFVQNNWDNPLIFTEFSKALARKKKINVNTIVKTEKPHPKFEEWLVDGTL